MATMLNQDTGGFTPAVPVPLPKPKTSFPLLRSLFYLPRMARNPLETPVARHASGLLIFHRPH